MAPILKKGLFCCLSLRTCALILGSITLVGNLMTLSMFVVSLDLWLSQTDYGREALLHNPQSSANHTAGSPGGHLDHEAPSGLPGPEVLANISHLLAYPPPSPPSSTAAGAHPGGAVLDADGDADADVEAHPWGHPDEDYFDGFDDSEAMEELLYRSPHLALALVWFDFVLVLLETLAVILLIWGAAKRRAELLLPWLGVEMFTTLYDLGFFAYLFLSNDIYIAIDLMPIIMLPLTVYCWLAVYSLYQECQETASRNAAMPLSMSALEAGAAGGNSGSACTVPYGRMGS